MSLLICKLFPNANEHMCSSLKSVKIPTSAVGVRRRTRLISYPDFPRPRGRETSYFKWRHAYSCKQLLLHLACVDPPLTRMPKRSAKCLWWIENYPPSSIFFSFDRWRPGRVEIAIHGLSLKRKKEKRGEGEEKKQYHLSFPQPRPSSPLFCNSTSSWRWLVA